MKKINFEATLKKLQGAPDGTLGRFIDREALRLFCETKNEMVKIEALKLLEKGIDRKAYASESYLMEILPLKQKGKQVWMT